jgi:hypothetical protein
MPALAREAAQRMGRTLLADVVPALQETTAT